MKRYTPQVFSDALVARSHREYVGVQGNDAAYQEKLTNLNAEVAKTLQAWADTVAVNKMKKREIVDALQKAMTANQMAYADKGLILNYSTGWMQLFNQRSTPIELYAECVALRLALMILGEI